MYIFTDMCIKFFSATKVIFFFFLYLCFYSRRQINKNEFSEKWDHVAKKTRRAGYLYFKTLFIHGYARAYNQREKASYITDILTNLYLHKIF